MLKVTAGVRHSGKAPGAPWLESEAPHTPHPVHHKNIIGKLLICRIFVSSVSTTLSKPVRTKRNYLFCEKLVEHLGEI